MPILSKEALKAALQVSNMQHHEESLHNNYEVAKIRISYSLASLMRDPILQNV